MGLTSVCFNIHKHDHHSPVALSNDFQLINRPIVEITKINADVREKIPSVTTNMINVAHGI